MVGSAVSVACVAGAGVEIVEDECAVQRSVRVPGAGSSSACPAGIVSSELFGPQGIVNRECVLEQRLARTAALGRRHCRPVTSFDCGRGLSGWQPAQPAPSVSFRSVMRQVSVAIGVDAATRPTWLGAGRLSAESRDLLVT